MNRITIVGAGQAGGQVAASLRQQGCKDKILLFGDEPYPPYQRPLLSKQYLSSEEERDRIFLCADTFYQDHNISFRLNDRIKTIDAAVNTVTTGSGEVIGYLNLVLTTGSRSRILQVPSSGLKGIYYLRTFDDAYAI